MNYVLIALVAGLSGMLGWGIADFFAKKTINKIGDLKTLIGSQVIGGVFLLVYYLFTKPTFPLITGTMFVYVLLLAILDAAGYLFLYRAFQKGIMSIVSPIGASAAGFSVIIAVLLFKEQLSVVGFLGVLLIFLGILITSSDIEDLKKSFSIANLNKGIFDAIASMILIGVWFLLWDKFVGNMEWLFWLILLKLLMGAVLCIYFYLTHRKGKLFVGYASVLKILIPVALLDALAYVGTTWGYSVTVNTTSLITVIANAYSLPTIILAYVFLKERITKQQALGVASIIGGIIVSSL